MNVEDRVQRALRAIFDPATYVRCEMYVHDIRCPRTAVAVTWAPSPNFTGVTDVCGLHADERVDSGFNVRYPVDSRGAGDDVAVEMVDHPAHYGANPSGVECIDVVEHMSFNVGNAMKYLWRADEKGKPIEDLEKARWYIDREIQRRKRADDGDAK